MSETHKCHHCLGEQSPGESFFWAHHGNPGPVPGYCVECAVCIVQAAFRYVDLRRDRELETLIAAVRPMSTP